jgi:plasmid stability protein
MRAGFRSTGFLPWRIILGEVRGGDTMSVQTVTVHLPEELYSDLKERADESNRSIEAEVLDVLAWAIPTRHGLPADIEEEFERLDAADDQTVWLAARSRLSPEAARQLEELHWKRQREGFLTPAEAQLAADLLEQQERAMLIRAHAVALWKRRGHDPSEFLISR